MLLRGDLRRIVVFTVLVFLATDWRQGPRAQGGASLPIGASGFLSKPAARLHVRAIQESLPLQFIPNMGQFDPDVRFVVPSSKHSVAFYNDRFRVNFIGPAARDSRRGAGAESLEMRLVGSSAGASPVGRDALSGEVNFLLGQDPSQWRSGLRAYSEIVYAGIYPAIDLKFSGRDASLESTFSIQPGGRVADIRIRCASADAIRLDAKGNLILSFGKEELVEFHPQALQWIGGVRVDVPVRFWLDRKSKAYGFSLEKDYDRTQPLIIDPIYGFATYLGGSSEDDGYAIALDSQGQIYVAGFTASTNFPTKSPFRPAAGGTGDAFIAKLAADGKSLIYSTYLGGSDRDLATALTIDSLGQACVVGETFSANFPIVSGFQATKGAGADGFIAKLAANGQSLLFSSFIGGSDFDIATAIAADSSGALYVAGQTYSTDLPPLSAFQPGLRGIADAFVIKLSPDGQTVFYLTYLGGSGLEGANGIAVNSAGEAYITGFTNSPTNFPTQSAYQAVNAGNTDVFVTKLGAGGKTLVFSTYFGGSDDDAGNALAIDGTGNVYVTGYTRSTDFPTAGAYQTANKGGSDAFLFRLSATGTSLNSSTYLGGAGQDEGSAIVRDLTGQVYVAGTTSSADFPITNAIRTSLSGDTDAFLSEFSSGLQGLVFSTFLGGAGSESAYGVAVDSTGRMYVTGQTRSNDFPTFVPLQPASGGGITDTFVVRIDPFEPTYVSTLYFPRLVTKGSSGASVDDSEFTGVAVTNLSTLNATLKLTAYDTTGAVVGGAGIANPTQIALAAKSQLAMLDTELFGSGLIIKKPTAWFKLESTVAEMVGFFLVFNSSLGVQDGADVSSATLTNFIFPEIEDQATAFTQFHVANPSNIAANLTLELVDSTGSTLATATPARTVPPSGVLVETVASLFPNRTFIGGMYVRGTSTRPVVTFEYLGKSGQYVEGLNGQDSTAGAKVVYSPQYVVGPGYRTTLSVVNLENTPTTVLMKLFDDNGNFLGLTKTVDLQARGKFQVLAQNYFVTPSTTALTTGYIQLTSDRANIGGSVVFGDPARNTFSAALPLVYKPQTGSIFSQVASDNTYFTGLAVLNPGDTNGSFLLEVLDKTGKVIASKTVLLDAKRRTSLLLTQHFPTLPKISSGYFRVTGTQGFLSFALFGTNSLNVLAAIPPSAAP